MDNAHRLYSLADRLPPEDGEWLKTGLGRWLSGEKLEDALAVNRHIYLINERNRHLREAYQCIEGDLPWPRCKKLLEEIYKFELQVWPRVKIHQEPPERLT